VEARAEARRDSCSRRRAASSTLSASAERRAAWLAWREGWIVCGEWVRAERSSGEERASARSCLLYLLRDWLGNEVKRGQGDWGGTS